MFHIHTAKYSNRIIRIYVADELRFHFQRTIGSSPVLQSKIDGTGAKVASADTDLNYGIELFTLFICDLACMDFIRKVRDLRLLTLIELSLIHTVCDDLLTQLSSAEMMQYKSVLCQVDNCAVIELLKLPAKLRFIGKCRKFSKNVIINCLCRIVVCKSLSHGNCILSHTLRAAFTFHRLDEIYSSLCLLQRLVTFKRIKIFPCNHIFIPPVCNLTISIC